jgi:cytochrome b6-f complex iron-sulfur subunit
MDGPRMGRRRFLVALGVVAACTDSGDPVAEQPGERAGGGDDGAGGFGGLVDAGDVDDVEAGIDAGEGFYYLPEARAFLVRYPAGSLDAAREVYDDPTIAGMEAGYVALYQKCPHLGCRVPDCRSSGRFECPCHVSVFTGVGELVQGPAPRGMDRFPLKVEDGRVLIDTAVILEGAPEGTSTTDGEPRGPACLQ